MTQLPQLALKKNEERRLRSGHQWIYSNEVDTRSTPLKGFNPGEICTVTNHRGNPVATAYVNPASLISARVLSRKPNQLIDRAWLMSRISQAMSLREQLFSRPFYRLVYGESDGLPGLVVDRYDAILVVQITTAGMEVMREDIIDVLRELCQPAGILLKNDSSIRELEGLETYVETVHGHVPDEIAVEENDTKFLVPVSGSQKTGWFYDHRLNRQRMRQYVEGKRVLDVFSYVGGWGVQALTAGAEQVMCIDSSSRALEYASINAGLNNRVDAMKTLHGDGFDLLQELSQSGERFDVVILDPPAFVKRRKDLKQGSLAYRRVNRLAMSLLGKSGVLVSASCSWHMGRDQLLNEIRQAGNLLDAHLQVLEQGHQGPDHPVHPAMSETDYLKAFICHVTASEQRTMQKGEEE